MVRTFANGPGDLGAIPGQVIPKAQKMILNTQYYKVRVKWVNPGKGVAPSPTLRCSSYWKGSLRVTLNYGRQLYLPLLLLSKFWLILIEYPQLNLLKNATNIMKYLTTIIRYINITN